MKTIDATTVIDFLRRIFETNNLENVEVSSTEFSKHLCYTVSENEYISLFIYEDDGIRLVIGGNLEKEIEFTPNEKTELFYYFNKIFEKKEEQSFNFLDKLYRYKGEVIEF